VRSFQMNLDATNFTKHAWAPRTLNCSLFVSSFMLDEHDMRDKDLVALLTYKLLIVAAVRENEVLLKLLVIRKCFLALDALPISNPNPVNCPFHLADLFLSYFVR